MASNRSPIVLVGVTALIVYVLAHDSTPSAASRSEPEPIRVETQPYVPLVQPASRVEKLQAQYESVYYAPMQAKVAWLCGLRTGDWYADVARNVESFHLQLMTTLTAEEREQMLAWQNGLVDKFNVKVTPNGNPTPQKCRDFQTVGIPANVDRINYEVAGG